MFVLVVLLADFADFLSQFLTLRLLCGQKRVFLSDNFHVGCLDLLNFAHHGFEECLHPLIWLFDVDKGWSAVHHIVLSIHELSFFIKLRLFPFIVRTAAITPVFGHLVLPRLYHVAICLWLFLSGMAANF